MTTGYPHRIRESQEKVLGRKLEFWQDARARIPSLAPAVSMIRNRLSVRNADELDIVSAIWILACNDENPMITYEGIRYRLGLPDDLTRNDIFRSQFRADEGAKRSDISIIDWGLQHIDRLRKAEIERKQLRTPLLVASVTALLSLLITLPTTYFSSRLTLANQIELNNTQKRHQLIGELMGRKAMMRQLYVSRFEAWIYSDYHEARWKLTGAHKDSFEFQEAPMDA